MRADKSEDIVRHKNEIARMQDKLINIIIRRRDSGIKTPQYDEQIKSRILAVACQELAEKLGKNE